MSLFDAGTTQKFIDRINRLQPDTPAAWGKMSVDQMLAHCQTPLDIAHGRIKPKVNPLVRLLFGKSAMKEVLGTAEFKKNLPTMGEARINGSRAFNEEKKKLIQLVQEFQQKGAQGLTKDPHPLFGELSSSEWDHMQEKHLDHHLRQFGV